MSQGQQYVCAGELVALQTLTNVLNYLKVEKVDIAKVRLHLVLIRTLLITDLLVDGDIQYRKSEGDAR